MYNKECISSVEEFLKENQFKENGLTNKEAIENKNKYGENILKQKRQKKWYNYLLESLFSSFNLILLGIVIVLIYTDIILQEVPNYANIIVILILILASTLLEFFEVYRSNKAAEKLKGMVSVKASVYRDGKIVKVPLQDITIGDVISLSAGDLIPADLRIVEAKDLYVIQSSLTGESDAVKKVVETENKKEDLDEITEFLNS